VDIYVNNRPVRSIDAQQGAVPATQVRLGKEHKRNSTVEVEARDRAGRLVAFRRTVVR
jgi:UTP:GlnB (protein PII) uridylyltransferase